MPPTDLLGIEGVYRRPVGNRMPLRELQTCYKSFADKRHPTGLSWIECFSEKCKSSINRWPPTGLLGIESSHIYTEDLQQVFGIYVGGLNS